MGGYVRFMIRGLIFDFDGLMLDTEGPDYQSWQETFQTHGRHLPFETWSAYIGGSAHAFDVYVHLEAALGRPVNRAAIRTVRRQRYAELVAAQEILPGVGDYIDAARRLGLKLGVASSSSREWVAGHLGRLGLDAHFDAIRCADDVARVKPHPDLYLAALAALDLHSHEAIALEDSPNGARAAKAAGLFCVAIPNPLTCELPLDHADLRLASLADLPLDGLIARINA